MIVKNTTIISKEEVLKTLISSAKKESLSKYMLSIIILLCGVGVLISGLSQSNTTYIVVASAFLAFGLAYIIMTTVSFIRIPTRIKKQNPDMVNNDIKYNYVIKEKSITATILNMGKKIEVNYKFEDIRKIYEEETRYQIRLKDNQVLYIDKNTFETEQGEKFFLRDIEINKTKFKLLEKKTQ